MSDITYPHYTSQDILNEIHATEIKILYETDSTKRETLHSHRQNLIQQLDLVSQIEVLTKTVSAMQHIIENELGYEIPDAKPDYQVNANKSKDNYLSQAEIYQYLLQDIELPDNVLKQMPVSEVIKSDFFNLGKDGILVCEGTSSNHWANVLLRYSRNYETRRGYTLTLYQLSKMTRKDFLYINNCGKKTLEDILFVLNKIHIHIN